MLTQPANTADLWITANIALCDRDWNAARTAMDALLQVKNAWYLTAPEGAPQHIVDRVEAVNANAR